MTVAVGRAAGETTFEGRTYRFCSQHCLKSFTADPSKYVASDQAGKDAAPPIRLSAAATSQGKAKDPICGMVIAKAGAVSAGLISERAGRTYYFCSPTCKHTFDDPERTRVSLALSGVLALAILRAGAFLALAAGATIMSWAPIPALPWFTWGVWLFLLVTPVQFIGGWSFYKGAWTAIRGRVINMDFLRAPRPSPSGLPELMQVKGLRRENLQCSI